MLAYKTAGIDLIQMTDVDQGTTVPGIFKANVHRVLWFYVTRNRLS